MELTGLFFLFTCQPTKSSNFSRSDVNVRAHLLRKNYSWNLSSIRSTPMSHIHYQVTLSGILGVVWTLLFDQQLSFLCSNLSNSPPVNNQIKI